MLEGDNGVDHRVFLAWAIVPGKIDTADMLQKTKLNLCLSVSNQYICIFAGR